MVLRLKIILIFLNYPQLIIGWGGQEVMSSQFEEYVRSMARFSGEKGDDKTDKKVETLEMFQMARKIS